MSEQGTYKQKVERKEQNILSAARETFLDKGYDKMRVSEVAKLAGVAEGTVYFYYKSKDDLIRALLADYWARLTAGANEAIAKTKETFPKLEALAKFHIKELMGQYEFAVLSVSLDRQKGPAITFRDEVRDYVRLFDEIFQSGIDKGDLIEDTVIWVARDMFYGTLEYSARTLLLRGQGNSRDVVKNLMMILETRYSPRKISTDNSLETRLEKAIKRMEGLLKDA